MKLSRLIHFVHEKLVYSDTTNAIKFLAGRNKPKTHYSYIASSGESKRLFIEDILKSDKKEGDVVKKFCDVGCGVPVIPVVMNILGYDSYGLEFEQVYCTYFNGYNDVEMIHGDMVSHDFKDFDYLYSYHPISDKTKMAKALVNVLTSMKKGATLYFNQSEPLGIDFSAYGKVSTLKDSEDKEQISCLYKIVKK